MDRDRAERERRWQEVMTKQSGRAVRPFREDGYVNMMNRYGTSRDAGEHYRYKQDPPVPDEFLTMYYESNGLFSKIIDAPAEEAVKHGFDLDIHDEKLTSFMQTALDELDWEETAMQALKWMRLFGGSIVVMLINDGRGLDEPLDWKNIRSIDDLRVYDRSVVVPDTSTLYMQQPADPFRTRGSRLGEPEFYSVYSRYGSFRVHESRCLVFRNGVLPENTSNSIYQLWGVPEYVRINRAIRDVEVAHGSAPKLLDRSIQPVYKMKDLAQELATEEGEDAVLRRLQAIDMARGMMNSIVIDSSEEDYDFKTFSYSGVSEVINTTCNYLSAVTSIPQTILFGRSPAGMNSTGESDLENYYNFVDRIRKRVVRRNLRCLLSVIFQAGVNAGEIDEVPPINIEFRPLWQISESEQIDIEARKAAAEQTRAATAQIYVDMQAVDPSEVRKKLAASDSFDVETMLDEPAPGPEAEPPEDPDSPEPPQTVSMDGSAAPGGAGVIVIRNGRLLTASRREDSGCGMITGPGGSVRPGENEDQAALREAEEEFGIRPVNAVRIGTAVLNRPEPEAAAVYLCTEFEGEPRCADGTLSDLRWRTLDELFSQWNSLWPPFAESLKILVRTLGLEKIFERNLAETVDKKRESDIIFDGGPGSGFFDHPGNPGSVGGSSSFGSADGENEPCTGFASEKKLEDHYSRHGGEYPNLTKAQYAEHAVNMIRQPCGGDIDGFITRSGQVVRFNRATGEYACGFPGGPVNTCFHPKFDHREGKPDPERAKEYFERQKAAKAWTPPKAGGAAEAPKKESGERPAAQKPRKNRNRRKGGQPGTEKTQS